MQLKENFNKLLRDEIKDKDKRVMQLEGVTEDMRTSQEQLLEELNKYQDNIENIIEQS